MPESKKVVIKVDVHDEKDKRKALRAVSRLSGIESIAMDMKDRKLTVIGDIDPVDVVGKLKKGWYIDPVDVVVNFQKGWHTEILTVGPAKEEKKKDDPKKEEKKDDKEDGDKKKEEAEAIKKLVDAYKAYNPYMTQHYHVYSMEENPNACVIC